LVPDNLVIALLRDILFQQDLAPVILDGFPRTLPQAQALDTLVPPKAVIYIEIHPDRILERITGRRVGPQGEIFNIRYNPPPAGVEVTQRSDDREDVVRKRLDVYYRQSEPLLHYYQEHKILRRIPGEGSIDEVFARIVPVIKDST
jgi:adenylate kinase